MRTQWTGIGCDLHEMGSQRRLRSAIEWHEILLPKGENVMYYYRIILDLLPTIALASCVLCPDSPATVAEKSEGQPVFVSI